MSIISELTLSVGQLLIIGLQSSLIKNSRRCETTLIPMFYFYFYSVYIFFFNNSNIKEKNNPLKTLSLINFLIIIIVII